MNEQIIRAIMKEREYQDREFGTIHENGHTVAEWLLHIERKLDRAKDAYFSRPSDALMIAEVVKIAAVCVACMEQHGVFTRNDTRLLNEVMKHMTKKDGILDVKGITRYANDVLRNSLKIPRLNHFEVVVGTDTAVAQDLPLFWDEASSATVADPDEEE